MTAAYVKHAKNMLKCIDYRTRSINDLPFYCTTEHTPPEYRRAIYDIHETPYISDSTFKAIVRTLEIIISDNDPKSSLIVSFEPQHQIHDLVAWITADDDHKRFIDYAFNDHPSTFRGMLRNAQKLHFDNYSRNVVAALENLCETYPP